MSIAGEGEAENVAEAVREVDGDEKVGAGGNDKGIVDEVNEAEDDEDEEELVPDLEAEGFEEAGAGSPVSEDGFGSDISGSGKLISPPELKI
jgi:hypothetical protein